MSNNVKAKDIHLILFLSRSTPLTRWDQMGIYSREIEIYKWLSTKLGGLSILTSGNKEELKYQDQLENIHILYNRWGLSPNLYSLFAPFLHAAALQRGTVYKTNQMDGAWTAIIAGKLHKKPVIVRAGYLWAELNRQSGASGLKASAMDRLQKLSFKRASKVFLTSQAMAEQVSKKYHVSTNNIRVIPNHVNTTLFRPLPEVAKISGRICYIGRLHPHKNLESLIRAVQELPETSLIIIGDGEERRKLEAMAEPHRSRIQFTGALPHDQIPLEINRAEIFMLPSRSEGHPKALIEAMACEAAVIGSDVPGISDLIQHGQNGLLCQTQAGSIQAGIQNLLSDSKLRIELGRKARQFVLENYTLKKVARLELTALLEVIGDGGYSPGGDTGSYLLSSSPV